MHNSHALRVQQRQVGVCLHLVLQRLIPCIETVFMLQIRLQVKCHIAGRLQECAKTVSEPIALMVVVDHLVQEIMRLVGLIVADGTGHPASLPLRAWARCFDMLFSDGDWLFEQRLRAYPAVKLLRVPDVIDMLIHRSMTSRAFCIVISSEDRSPQKRKAPFA